MISLLSAQELGQHAFIIGEIIVAVCVISYLAYYFAKSKKRKLPLSLLRSNRSGLMYLYLVLIIGLIALIFLCFMFSSVIQTMQETFNPMLGVDTWATTEHFNAFYLAEQVVTNLWTYVFVLAFVGLSLYAYIYTQRRGV